jgi:hypothetical protein
MNERIIKLGLESGMLNYVEHETPRHYFLCANADEECLAKFAELIVRECVNVGLEQKKWVEDMEVFNEQDATWNRARIQQSQQIVDKIKQHFGVE